MSIPMKYKHSHYVRKKAFDINLTNKTNGNE